MKVEAPKQEIFGNTTTSNNFSIAGNAMAFKILSSGIYKNKIRAVVRELVCNCVDAHMINNQSKPFEVYVPTVAQQSFKVRDFGLGLSEKAMSEVYTQYFNSTKTQNEIGGFGLGAKSPFSYTDTFTVTSYFEGVVRIYSMYVNNGHPQMTKTYEGPFEDGDVSGVCVTVPINSDDLSKWEKEIAYIMRPFDPKTYTIKGPELDIIYLGNSDIHTSPSKDSGYFSIRQNNVDGYSKISAIYGSIVYPISINDIDDIGCEWLKALPSNLYTFVNFEMNTLMPQPSREQLQHDEITLNTLRNKLKALDKTLKDKDLALFDGQTCPRKIKRILTKLGYVKTTILANENYLINDKPINYYESNEYLDGFDIDGLVENFNNFKVYKRAYSSSKPLNVKPFATYSKKAISLKNLLSYDNDSFNFICLEKYSKVKQFADTFFKLNPDVEYVCLIDNSEHGKALVDNTQKYLFGDKVDILNCVDLDDDRKRLFPSNAKSSSQGGGISYPTATRYYKDGNNIWQCKHLYLSAKDVQDLDGYVIGYSGGAYCSLTNHFNDRKLSIGDIDSFVNQFSFDKDFVVLKSRLFTRALKNNALKCLIKELQSITISKSKQSSDWIKDISFKVDSCTSKALSKKGMEKIRKKYYNCVDIYGSIDYNVDSLKKCKYSALNCDVDNEFNILSDQIKDIKNTKKHDLETLVNEIKQKLPILNYYLSTEASKSFDADVGIHCEKMLVEAGFIA